MKDNIITYFYKGVASTILFLVGKKEKIASLFAVEKVINLNTTAYVDKANQVKIERQEMLDMPKITFKYKARNKDGKIINSSFDAYNVDQAKNFLVQEGLEVIEIKARSKFDVDITIGNVFPIAELAFALTQLSTYIKSGISLVDSFRILAKQTKKNNKRKVYELVIYDLLAGDSLSEAFSKQKKAFPKLLVNMVKSAELTGDLPSTLDDMADYYSAIDKTRKEIKSAMTYPSVVFFFSIAVVSFVLIYIVPQYESMFAGYGIALPKITRIVLSVSDFLQKNLLFVVSMFVVILFIYMYLFKNIKSFRKLMQTVYLHLPVVKNIIMYSEISMFTKTFSSLLNHGVFITDSMDVLLKVSENEVYREVIENTVRNLNLGGKISESFKDHWAIPVVAYEMIVTGENTGKLGEMMEKVYVYYDDLHTNAIGQIKSLMEPFLIVFLAGSVGLILLSIVLPMFEMYGALS